MSMLQLDSEAAKTDRVGCLSDQGHVPQMEPAKRELRCTVVLWYTECHCSRL